MQASALACLQARWEMLIALSTSLLQPANLVRKHAMGLCQMSRCKRPSPKLLTDGTAHRGHVHDL